jgi:hypothetical protein
MDSTQALPTASGHHSWKLGGAFLAVAAAGSIAVAIAMGALDRPVVASAPAATSGLSAQQVVIRGEVADRYAASQSGVSAQQLVTRSEVADRYGTSDSGLSAEQIVVRGEVADRYADR